MRSPRHSNCGIVPVLSDALLIAAAYLVGSVPFGLLLARRFAGVDVRGAGSGNIGATNVARTAGKGLGIATLALDAGKGAVPVFGSAALGASLVTTCAAAVAAVLGHVFPIWLRFKGGKGVATVAGAFMALSPIATLAALGAFVIAFAAGRVVSVASLVGSLALIGGLVLIDRRTPVWVAGAAVVALVFVRHAANIGRLLQGREGRL